MCLRCYPKMTEPLLFVLAGPHGVGKKTLMKRLRYDHPNEFAIFPLHTSAMPSKRTSSGFYFVHHTREEMLKVIADDDFLTHWMYDGDVYGVNKHLLTSYLEVCRVCFFAVEGVEAILRLQKCGIKANFIYVSPPSTESFTRRLRLAGFHGDRKTEARVRDARLMEEFYEDSSECFKLRIVNHKIHESYQEIKDLVLSFPRATSCPIVNDVIAQPSRFASLLDLSILKP